jgi:DNA polymerase
MFLDADYAAIEARIVNWLAGQEDALEEYRQGVDRYKRMASVIYGIPEEQVNRHPQRFIGKQAILLCGFQGGPPKFRQTCEKFGYKDMPKGLEDMAVGKFREQHDCIVRYWPAVENAAKRAITTGDLCRAIPKLRKGETASTKLPKFQNVQFLCKTIEGTKFLLIQLPSGRKLAYPRPRIVPGKFEGTTAIQFFGHIMGTTWGNVDTYGGKLVENITQAVAADIMTCGAHNAERAGYQIATLIHDQALAYHREGQTAEEFVRLLTNLPDWAKGLPIEAEGGLVPFYKKD